MIIRYLIAFLASLILATGFYYRLHRPLLPSEQMGNLDYACHSKAYNDVIYIGSSRVLRQVNAPLIDSLRGLKSYALGIDQIGIIESTMLLKKYLQVHPQPKTVVLNIDLSSFMFNTDSGGPYNIDEYFSYLGDTLIYKELSPHNWQYRYHSFAKYLYVLYPIQKLMIKNDFEKRELFISTQESPKAEPSPLKQGFLGNSASWNDVADQELAKLKTMKLNHTATTPEGFKLLEEFCQICHQKNIHCLLVFAPWYAQAPKSDNHEAILEQVASIAKQHQATFVDMRYLPISKSKDYFYDVWHYNLRGANVYSKELAKYL